ncbi:hypothetical protein PPERSA_07578 [Pseudocohnilembus persalinus]|uniref:Insulin-like growth factor binding protein, N-terminal n=1 Tax=Pseudocohnilembus persalinus TaxID=266149 RepID=A0A0V0QZY5_PSEPJ|nr:hypothetical protein PPERSA_07578 [Pseudocohnilembus persalinus]|eukprot:KRX07828.1 hypothetical protein PPERSA_07578 [Pseudocohnilembus persalinus]
MSNQISQIYLQNQKNFPTKNEQEIYNSRFAEEKYQQRKLISSNCDENSLPNIFYDQDGETDLSQIECLPVNIFLDDGECEQFIYVVQDWKNEALSSPQYFYNQVCLQCLNDDQNLCECPENEFFNYLDQQCEQCPDRCSKCTYDILGQQQILCYECISSDTVPPDCNCPTNSFFLDSLDQCKTCQELVSDQLYFYDYSQEDQSCLYYETDAASPCYYLNKICRKCSDSINIFCESCLDKTVQNDQLKCIKCLGQNRDVNLDCACYENYIPNPTSPYDCIKCEDSFYLDPVTYSTCSQEDMYNNANNCDYDSLCLNPTVQTNDFCEEVKINSSNNIICIKCKGNRLPPLCECDSGQELVPDSSQLENCKQCEEGTYFSLQKYNDNCKPSGILNYECEENQICQNCNDINTLCLACTSDRICYKCDGENRQTPDCDCMETYVPNPTNTKNCKKCEGDLHFYPKVNSECTLQQKLDKDTGCQYSDICMDFQFINLYCTDPQYDNNEYIEVCQQCKGNRVPPTCQCQDNMLPITGNKDNCDYCDTQYYYDQELDNCKNIPGNVENFNCSMEEACQPCTNHNKYCLQCNKQECLICEGNRSPPHCKCQQGTLVKKEAISTCVYCANDTFYDDEQDKCKINANDGEYDCFYENICIPCKERYNQFCTQCSKEKCNSCAGNRVVPNCKCPEQKAPKKTDILTCQTCENGKYYEPYKDKCKEDTNDGEYQCFLEQICVSCTEINIYCTECTTNEGCVQCGQNRNLPHCKCPLNMVQSDVYHSLCVECPSGTYYEYNYDICRADIQDQLTQEQYVNYLKCTEEEVCQKCSNLNKFCESCSKNYKSQQISCHKCLGDLNIIEFGEIEFSGQNLDVTSCGCSRGSYSFSNETSVCQSCVDNVECLGFNILDLEPGYWREGINSDQIYSCQNKPENCLGGQADFTCQKGYMGALCEACDSYGDIWGQSYGAEGQYQCVLCNRGFIYFKVFLFTILMSFLTAYMSYQGVLEVQTQLQEEVVDQAFTEKFGLKIETDQMTIYIKIFLQYFASISIISSLDIIDLSFSDSVTQVVGNPSQLIGFTVDCFAADIGRKLPISYLRITYLILQFICYILVCVAFFLIFKKQLFKTKQKITYCPQNGNPQHYKPEYVYDPSPPIKMLLIKVFIFLFIDIQPSFINVLVNSLSCKKIGEKSYQMSDTTLECDTTTYTNFSYYYSLPLLLFWAFVMPIILAKILQNSSKKNKYGKKIKQTQEEEEAIKNIFKIQQQKYVNKELIFQYDDGKDQTHLDSFQMKYKYGFLYLEKHNVLEAQGTKASYLSLIFALLFYYSESLPLKILATALMFYVNGLFIFNLASQTFKEKYKKLKTWILKKLSFIEYYRKKYEKSKDSLHLAAQYWKIIKKFLQMSIYLKSKKQINLVRNKNVDQDSLRLNYPGIEDELVKHLEKKEKEEKAQFRLFQKSVRKLFKQKQYSVKQISDRQQKNSNGNYEKKYETDQSLVQNSQSNINLVQTSNKSFGNSNDNSPKTRDTPIKQQNQPNKFQIQQDKKNINKEQLGKRNNVINIRNTQKQIYGRNKKETQIHQNSEKKYLNSENNLDLLTQISQIDKEHTKNNNVDEFQLQLKDKKLKKNSFIIDRSYLSYQDNDELEISANIPQNQQHIQQILNLSQSFSKEQEIEQKQVQNGNTLEKPKKQRRYQKQMQQSKSNNNINNYINNNINNNQNNDQDLNLQVISNDSD